MAKSKWKTMTEEQKQQHRDGERTRRTARALKRTDEQKATLSKQRKQWAGNRDGQHIAKVAKEYKRNGKGYFFSWANSIKARAQSKGIPYNLDADFLQSIMPTHCPILGILLERHVGRGTGPFSPTVDRIFPEKGYVRDNVMIISKRANQIKSDASPEEISKVARYYTLLYEGLKE